MFRRDLALAESRMKHFFFALLTAVVSTVVSAAPAAFDVKVSGKGSPIILIPGHSCSGAVWDATVARYAATHECHVLTLAGFAGVPPIAAPFTDTVEKEIAAYISEKHLQHPVLIGHSFGGFVGLRLAAHHPELLGGLIIVDSLPFLAAVRQPGCTVEQAKATAQQMAAYMNAPDEAAYKQNIRSGVFTRMLVDSAVDHERIVEWGLATDRGTSTRAMTELYSSDLRDELPLIKCPTLVLGAAKTYVAAVGLPAIEALYRDQYSKLAGARVLVTDKANHFIMYDAPEWMFSQIDTFLTSNTMASLQ